MIFERVSTLPVPLRAYPFGLNDSAGTAPPDVDDVAVVGVGAAVVEFVPAVAAVDAVVASCALAVVEMMLVIHDCSVLSAGDATAHETSRRDDNTIIRQIAFFIISSLSLHFHYLKTVNDAVFVEMAFEYHVYPFVNRLALVHFVGFDARLRS